jgi:hypothetical protein
VTPSICGGGLGADVNEGLPPSERRKAQVWGLAGPAL